MHPLPRTQHRYRDIDASAATAACGQSQRSGSPKKGVRAGVFQDAVSLRKSGVGGFWNSGGGQSKVLLKSQNSSVKLFMEASSRSQPSMVHLEDEKPPHWLQSVSNVTSLPHGVHHLLSASGKPRNSPISKVRRRLIFFAFWRCWQDKNSCAFSLVSSMTKGHLLWGGRRPKKKLQCYKKLRRLNPKCVG